MRRLGDRAFEISLRAVWPGRAWPQRYALPIVLTIAVTAVKFSVPAFGAAGPDLFLTIPVAVSAIVAGLGPAIVAVLGATAVAAYFTPPAFEMRLFSRLDAIEVAGFFIEGAVIALLGAGLRGALMRTLESLRRQEQLEGERAALLATIQHELRNPLAALSGQLDLATRYTTRDGASERIGDAIAAARAQVARLLRLTEDLVLVSVPEASFRVDVERVDLRAAVDAAILRARATTKDRELRAVLPAHPLHADADPARVDQILDNLVKNAVHFSPSGSRVEISAMRVDFTSRAIVRVRDEGPGVEPQERERIFDRFVRGRAAAAIAGSGIGLYVSRELATRMGGRLVLEETSPLGSVFALELPLAALDARDRDASVVA